MAYDIDITYGDCDHNHLKLYLYGFFPCTMKKFNHLMKFIRRGDFGFYNSREIMLKIESFISNEIASNEHEMNKLKVNFNKIEDDSDYRYVSQYKRYPSGELASQMEIADARQKIRIIRSKRNSISRRYKEILRETEKYKKQLSITEDWLNSKGW